MKSTKITGLYFQSMQAERCKQNFDIRAKVFRREGSNQKKFCSKRRSSVLCFYHAIYAYDCVIIRLAVGGNRPGRKHRLPKIFPKRNP